MHRNDLSKVLRAKLEEKDWGGIGIRIISKKDPRVKCVVIERLDRFQWGNPFP